MNIRPVQISDISDLQEFMPRASCVFGSQLARTWQIENQVKESVTAFLYGEGESASNYIFVAYENAQLMGMLELHTLIGYGINCLSYSRSKALHRSDMLSVCHEQQVITLDQGLLGQHSLALCVVANGRESLAKDLISAALGFLASGQDKFSGHICVSLPVSSGEHFWRVTGLPLTGISYQDCNHHHAELLPQTPLYECFLDGALLTADSNDALHEPLAIWLRQQGFIDSARLSVFDGGPILTRLLG
ncbi:hypothetical protein R50072_02490 [Simiduia litorea]|uniref:arginine N-succinyltransferase n=1 Tax=Simiduia litorea TaxID=1435348 RepID=UPI0036F1C509